MKWRTPILRNPVVRDFRYKATNGKLLIFLRIPATGNSWRRVALYGTGRESKRFKGRHDGNIEHIAFVRNPISRFVSMWWLHWPELKFDKILSTMETADVHNIDPHLRPQWTFLENLNPKFLGKFECLFEDWARLRGKYPELGVTKRRMQLKGQPDWFVLMDDEQLDRVSEFYRRDLNQFGYLVPGRNIA